MCLHTDVFQNIAYNHMIYQVADIMCVRKVDPWGGGTEDCTQIASFSCPPVLCEEWGCSCFDTVTRNGTFGQAFSADKNTGTATCWVDEGVDQCNMGDVSEDESKRCRERGESV